MSAEHPNTSSSSALEQEIRKLGENIGALLRAMWECEERKSIEREVISALENVNRTLTQATERVQAKRARIRNTITEVWETAHGPQIVREVELGLADTLHKINEALSQRTKSAPAYEAQPTTADEPPPAKPE